MEYDKTLKPGDVVWISTRGTSYANCGMYVIRRIEDPGTENPTVLSQRISDKHGKLLSSKWLDRRSATFCHRITKDFVAEMYREDIELAVSLARQKQDRINQFLKTGKVPRPQNKIPKVHKYSEGQPGWTRKHPEQRKHHDDREKIFGDCGVNVSTGSYCKDWSRVTCGNCLRDMEESLTTESLVVEMRWSARVCNVLKQMEVLTLQGLSQLTEKELLAYRNIGETCIREIRRMLALVGLDLAETQSRRARNLGIV